MHSEVGDLIDWYNIQFYNRKSANYCLPLPPLISCALEGATEYVTPEGLLTASSSTWPNTAVFQIHASGVPLHKIVIGKPATSGDAASGYMDTDTLASSLERAKKSKWSKCCNKPWGKRLTA